MKNLVWLLFAIVILAGCTSNTKVIDINSLPEVVGSHLDNEPFTPTVGSSIGDSAPDFTLADIDGNTITLSHYRGNKPVLLFFWTTWCPACIHDLGIIKKQYPNYQDDIVIFAVNMDKNEDEEKIKEFVAENPNPGLIWADSDELLKTYNVLYTSTKVAIDRNGEIIWRGSGEMKEAYFLTLFDGLKNS